MHRRPRCDAGVSPRAARGNQRALHPAVHSLRSSTHARRASVQVLCPASLLIYKFAARQNQANGVRQQLRRGAICVTAAPLCPVRLTADVETDQLGMAGRAWRAEQARPLQHHPQRGEHGDVGRETVRHGDQVSPRRWQHPPRNHRVPARGQRPANCNLDPIAGAERRR